MAVLTKKKKTKLKSDDPTMETEPGIIYLSRIPTNMNVKIIRNLLSQYGEIGRIFLQRDGTSMLRVTGDNTII